MSGRAGGRSRPSIDDPRRVELLVTAVSRPAGTSPACSKACTPGPIEMRRDVRSTPASLGRIV